MSRVVVVEQPKPVISLEEAKAQLRVDGDDEDTLINGYIAAAIGEIDGPDGWFGRAIGEQVLELTLDGFDGSPIVLPYQPVGEVLEVRYRSPHDGWRVLDPTTYDQFGDVLDSAPGMQWPTVRRRDGIGAVVIRYEAGYAKLPDTIRVALLLMIESFYVDRGQATDVPASAMRLLQPLRVFV